MTYIATDQSVEDGNPVLLFEFAQGGTTWRYSNVSSNVVYSANTYTASAIGMGEVEQSADMAKVTLQITLPRSNALAIALLSDTSDTAMSVTVFRGHIDDGNFITYWKGRVSRHSSSINEVTLECEPIFTSLKRAGLRARYQKTCRHVLYGSGCGLTSTDWDAAATVTAISGTTVTLLADPSGTSGYYTGGMIEYGGQLIYISNHTSTTLTLMRPFVALATEVAANGNTAVALFAGCDHTSATCLAKFANLNNYGGFPYIPSKNPMGGGSIV